MKLNIVDISSSKGMNGADIPEGTVFAATRDGYMGLYVKYHPLSSPPLITIICTAGYTAGHTYKNIERMLFPDYKVVEELTAVVK